MAKEFALAVQRDLESDEVEADERMPFTMADDDTQLYALPPTTGQLALLAGAMSEFADEGRVAASVMDMFWSLLDEDTGRHLRGRLRDRKDVFELEDVMNILEWVVEETTARPTKQPSDYLESRASSGRRSTAPARKRASTRSPSPRIVSAT